MYLEATAKSNEGQLQKNITTLMGNFLIKNNE